MSDTNSDTNFDTASVTVSDTASDTSSAIALSKRAGPSDTEGMNVSPLDLRQQKFKTAFRGFDKVEVTSLLMAVAEDYEQALREADRLRQDLTRMEAVLNEHREHERSLKTTLMAAHKLADDIKAHAEEEAGRLVRDAQSRADMILEKCEGRLEDVQREIDGLKLKRKDVEVSLESTIQTLRNTLEYVREQETREKEEKILLHRPRFAEMADPRSFEAPLADLPQAVSR